MKEAKLENGDTRKAKGKPGKRAARRAEETEEQGYFMQAAVASILCFFASPFLPSLFSHSRFSVSRFEFPHFPASRFLLFSFSQGLRASAANCLHSNSTCSAARSCEARWAGYSPEMDVASSTSIDDCTRNATGRWNCRVQPKLWRLIT